MGGNDWAGLNGPRGYADPSANVPHTGCPPITAGAFCVLGNSSQAFSIIPNRQVRGRIPGGFSDHWTPCSEDVARPV